MSLHPTNHGPTPSALMSPHRNRNQHMTNTMSTDNQTVTTRDQYINLFDNLEQAMNFEASILNAGREFLTPCMQAVYDDNLDPQEGFEPRPTYWQGLADDLAQVNAEQAMDDEDEAMQDEYMASIING